ncbi:1,4-alpha-glucan branching protein GlgB [Actibacterium sp. D379-3]
MKIAAKDVVTGIAPEEACKLQNGIHDDPFSVLGPHKIGRRWFVVAMDPGAETMSIESSEGVHPMLPVPQAPAVFVGRLPRHEPYRLRGAAGDATWVYDDAYRYGPVLGEMDEYLFAEGTHRRLWQVLGAHLITHEGTQGTHFAVWAPNAWRVSVVGDFNFWDGRRHAMRRRGSTGVWEVFVPDVGQGVHYKYEIVGPDGTLLPLKADPVGFGAEHPPSTASVVRDIGGHDWQDGQWMAERTGRNARTAPITIYEVHLGSWRKRDGWRRMSYLEAAGELVDYVADMGFTHIEFMPVSEHPFDGSWGYQPVGLYAPTIRYGTPGEFRALVEAAHAKGLGVILDWVPGHFPNDDHGLARFDGTSLYEYADPREGFHQDWNTLIYNFGRAEVANFLISNALYWLEEYHVDGLRVDAVASMLYRDYSRQPGEWVANVHGGRENLEAISMLQRMNITTYGEVGGILTAAEESTSFPAVSQPVHEGGLGFGYKWNMGWMNDTLDYISREPIHRQHHHHQMTFGLHYAFSENFILPISHDEVVHGKGSMLAKMPGNEWEKFANLRAYYGFMWGHPGKKLLFMGCEFGQPAEWNHDWELDWSAAGAPQHAGLARLVRDLNTLYRAEPALHYKDCDGDGFEWIEPNDATHSVFAWMRRGGPDDPLVVVVCNFTPVERQGWHIGLPAPGRWREALNSDAEIYGGGGRGNLGGVDAVEVAAMGRSWSAPMTLPPLSTMIFVHESEGGRTT